LQVLFPGARVTGFRHPGIVRNLTFQYLDLRFLLLIVVSCQKI
jgi:hypothetical protein